MTPKLSFQDLKVICPATDNSVLDDAKGMFKKFSNIRHYDFEDCPVVSLLELENFQFKVVVSFNVSARRPKVSFKGKLLKSIIKN